MHTGLLGDKQVNQLLVEVQVNVNEFSMQQPNQTFKYTSDILHQF